MMVSTKGRYALRVLIDLAEHQTDGYIPLKDTAARQEISEKYLEGIIKILVKAKLLEGVRGKGGGYRLTKAPEQYTVGSILRLTENSMAPVACLEPGSTDCPRMGSCKTLPLWQGLDKVVERLIARDESRGANVGDEVDLRADGFGLGLGIALVDVDEHLVFLLELLDHGAGIVEDEAERAHDDEARHRDADGREGHEAVQEHAAEAFAQ